MAEKPMPLIAVVLNTSKGEVRHKWNGFAYIWRPGEEKQMSVELAHFFAGDPDIKDVNEALREKRRVLDFYPEDIREFGSPLKIVKTIDPNDAPVEVEEESVVVVDSNEDEEEPFADLTDKRIATDGILVNAPRLKGRPKKVG